MRILNPLICLSAEETPGKCGICKGTSNSTVTNRGVEEILVEMFKKFLSMPTIDIKLRAIDAMPAISRHFPDKFLSIVEDILREILKPDAVLLTEFATKVSLFTVAIKDHQNATDLVIRTLLAVAKESLATPKNRDLQLAVLRVIREFSLVTEIEMATFVRFFKLTLLFLMRDECRVVSEAMLVCDEMCMRRKFKPRNMFNWYKQSILEMIVPLTVSIYLEKGITIQHSLVHVAKLFEYFGPSAFIYENHPLLLAHLLPFVVKVS